MSFTLLSTWQWVLFSIGALLAAAGTYLLARWSWRWLVVVLLLVAAVVFLVVLPARFPAQNLLDGSTPPLLLNYFWTWILLLVVGMTFSGIFLVRTISAGRPAVRQEAAAADATETYPDIQAAWGEIQLRLGQAQIELGSQGVILVLSPSEDWTAALMQSASLQLFAQAPETAAPIHAFATAEGVLLSVAGASAFGTQEVEGVRRLESVCRLLLAERPDCPIVRGVAVLFPISWAGLPDSIKWASSLRDDLRAIERTFKLRCPVFALFPQMESAPGFPEFAGRMSAAVRQGRCGFAVPSSQAFSGDLVQRGLVWMSGWFHGWILNLMAEDLFNHSGNNRLFLLDHEFRRYRKRMRSVVEAAFSTHSGTEPVLFRGCYFLATGEGPREQAFTAGLLRGPRGRIFADHTITQWTRQAKEDDRFYRQLALAIGLAGGVLVLLSWVAIVMVTSNLLWWIAPVVLAIVWLVTIFRISRW